MLMAVVHNQDNRRKRVRPSSYKAEKGPITRYDLISANHNSHKTGRLCGDLEKLQKHIDLAASSKNMKPYEVCGLECYITCGLFKRSQLNFFPHKGSQKIKSCFSEYRDYHFLAYLTRI